MSAPPPAAKGTITFTGRLGYSCAVENGEIKERRKKMEGMINLDAIVSICLNNYY
jgi:hypothetical protein